MAIKWKTNVAIADHSSAVEYTLCDASEDMSTIKSVNIVNANPSAVGAAFISVWIDTSGQDPSSPEYSTVPIYLVKNKQLSTQRVAILGSIISNATWSSNGAVLKCSVIQSQAWQNAFGTTSNWWQGSFILSGQNDINNTAVTVNQF